MPLVLKCPTNIIGYTVLLTVAEQSQPEMNAEYDFADDK